MIRLAGPVAVRLAGAGALVVLGALGALGRLEAHELGTTKVAVQLDEVSQQSGGHYRIAIDTDAESLLEKLESVAGGPVAGSPARDVATRLSALADTFRARVDVLFDGMPVRPDISIAVTPPTGDLSGRTATIVLTGAVPSGHSRFAWRYGWTFATYALTTTSTGGGSASTEWLEGGESSRVHTLGARAMAPSREAVVRQYLTLGVTHILPHGFDHMLFILSLFLLSTHWRPLLWQVSAFTVAHSLTLGLGMYGQLGPPPAIVEPLIALSIVCVAVENLLRTTLHPSRVAVVFGFGLLHGLGFAGALTTLGLPRGEFLTALVSFNVGVECGQLLVIGGAFALVGWYQRRPTYRWRVVLPASLAIAGIALYWTVERAVALR